jgi:gamma-glutamylcyclotransferase (GGCT)/AIG2-like uncharacterized protein YtfP
VQLFAYGTLRDPACVERIVGRALPARPARLPGYRREEPPGCHPYVVADPDAAVDGVLLGDVDDTALAALDRYEDEGTLYRRTPATALCDGTPVACAVYVFLRPARRG